MAARLYTHGWDLFAPTSMLARHMWARRRPTFWEQFSKNTDEHQQRRESEREAYRTLRVKMRVEEPLPGDQVEAYGLGTKRSLADYERYAGVNLLTRAAQPRAWAGATARPSNDEILAKFGGVGFYHAALRKGAENRS